MEERECRTVVDQALPQMVRNLGLGDWRIVVKYERLPVEVRTFGGAARNSEPRKYALTHGKCSA